MKKKFYVVWEGAKTGVFDDWRDCEKQIKGYAGAKYKSFETLAAAEAAFREAHFIHIKKKEVAPPDPLKLAVDLAHRVGPEHVAAGVVAVERRWVAGAEEIGRASCRERV